MDFQQGDRLRCFCCRQHRMYTANDEFSLFHFNNVNTNYQALRRAKLYFTDDLVPVYRLSGLEAETVRGGKLRERWTE